VYKFPSDRENDGDLVKWKYLPQNEHKEGNKQMENQ
jgi:hypothetical protein